MSTPEQFAKLPPAVSASRISGLLSSQFNRYNNHSGLGGYRAYHVTDEHAPMQVVAIEYHGIRKDLGPGRYSDSKVANRHRARLIEIRTFLRENGYTVTWGWDDETEEPDTNWLAVITPQMARERADVQISRKTPQTDAKMILTIQEAEDAAKEVGRAYASGKDEAARRLEQKLYTDVLVSIVAGSDDAVDLSAAALATQKLYFPR